LYALKKGDDIQVQYRDIGWAMRKFSHITHGGQVGYYKEGDVEPDPLGLGRGKLRVRFTPVKFVRVPQA